MIGNIDHWSHYLGRIKSGGDVLNPNIFPDLINTIPHTARLLKIPWKSREKK
jgi:hypothetical protein